ncbi:hypothetical protein [Dankookia sp. P2]|uniref:hypothetical protein n=1 Tax=Dankookia sp. P2 TaxID=3423955 RepID=UPI003D67DD10
MLGALPEGWAMLGRCRTGTAGPVGYPTGCWALAHPTTGVALVDVAPDATPNAEARLRRALGAANFWPAFPGYLPVWHGRIELAAWRSLPGIMAEGFSRLPPLTVPGKGAWIAAARAALAEDGAWDVPGAAARGPRAMPVATPMDDEDVDDVPVEARRPWHGRLGLMLGFAATFVVGLASGVMLLSDAPPATPAAPPPINLAALPIPAATPPREAAAPAAAPPAAVLREAEPVVAAMPAVPQPIPETATERVAEAPPVLPPAVPAPSFGGSDTGEPAEVASASLPLPPTVPKAPVQKAAARAPDRIDRACTQAVFRFQQGLPLSPAEQAHVRNGCATRR